MRKTLNLKTTKQVYFEFKTAKYKFKTTKLSTIKTNQGAFNSLILNLNQCF